LLESVTGGEQWARYSFLGFDPDCIVRGGGRIYERVIDGQVTERHEDVDPWACLARELAAWDAPTLPDLPAFYGGAVGFVAYDAVSRFEPTVPTMPKAQPWEFCFALGGPLLIFDNLRKTLTLVLPTRPAETAPAQALASAEARIRVILRQLRQAPAPPDLPPVPDGKVERHAPLPPSSMSRAQYCAAVERARALIHAGEIFQVVLSQRFEVDATDIAPLSLYRAMRVLNPSPYMYYLDFGEMQIVGASPETLVRVREPQVFVRPIAGTRPRGRDGAEDAANAAELCSCPKELAEHTMLVDLGRNDVGRVSQTGSVRVRSAMQVERYSHVMHLVSEVEGILRPQCSALDVLRATFPAGTLSGAPKVRAMQIIAALEPVARDVYGGAVGYIGFGGRQMDLAIAIRTAVLRQQKLFLQAGAGIVADSDPTAEFEETVNKARAALLAATMAKQAAGAIED
ncbi:MAG: anthranilate synthase component I family protein, partial [Polyangiales bacterium]